MEEKLTIFDALFGCWHKRTTFPLTSRRGQRRSEAASRTGTYVVCLDCGREFAYDWQKMRVMPSRKQEAFAPTPTPVEAKAS
jgi:hypothetical protein